MASIRIIADVNEMIAYDTTIKYIDVWLFIICSI